MMLRNCNQKTRMSFSDKFTTYAKILALNHIFLAIKFENYSDSTVN